MLYRYTRIKCLPLRPAAFPIKLPCKPTFVLGLRWAMERRNSREWAFLARGYVVAPTVPSGS